MQNVLVLVHDDPGQPSRLQAAFDLVRALRGHLICLNVTLPAAEPRELANDGGSLVVAEATTDNRARVKRRVKAQGFGYNWIDCTDTIDGAIIENAGSADIIVLSTPRATNGPAMESAIGKALTVAHKAVLAVPKDAPCMRVAGEAMFAWDGSRQAVAALHASLPLLRHSRAVTIVEIDDGSLNIPASEAQSYLAQRNVEASVRHDLAFGEKAGWLLVEQVGLLRADYVVMGGFGYPRAIEQLFGGATHRLLHESPVPIFLKH